MSVRWLTRILLVLQAAAALAVGWGVWRWAGVAPGLALASGVAAVAGLRLLVNMNNFVLAACFASATPPAFRLGSAGWLRLLAGEFCASMLTTSWRMPRAVAGIRVHQGSTALPVLLIHGYGCNSGYWDKLVPLLDAARISHASVDLAPIAGDIDGYAAQVERAADALCAATGAARLAVVGHSMGGLVARAWMRAYGGARVAQLLTLGTPHHGSALARFGPGINAAQMRCDGSGAASIPSPWLQALAAGENETTRARIVSLYSHHDNIVSPQTSSLLPGARNIAFGGIGHVALGSDARVLAQVMATLAQTEPAVAPEVAPEWPLSARNDMLAIDSTHAAPHATKSPTPHPRTHP